MARPTTPPIISYISGLVDITNDDNAALTVKAKAVYEYASGNPDEMSFGEGEVLQIVDREDEAWWKAEKGGMVYIVPKDYLEVEDG